MTVWIALTLIATSCGSSSGYEQAEPVESATHDGIAYDFGKALIDTEEGSVIVDV